MNGGLTGSQAEYARHLGISRAGVQKRKASGHLIFASPGVVDFAASDAAFAAQADPVRVTASPTAAASPMPATAAAAPAGGGFQGAKAQREYYLAQTAKLEFEKATGQVVDRELVEDAMMAAGRSIRRSLDALLLRSDEIDAAARQGGVNAVRRVLREALIETQTAAAEALRGLAIEAADDASSGAPDVPAYEDELTDA